MSNMSEICTVGAMAGKTGEETVQWMERTWETAQRSRNPYVKAFWSLVPIAKGETRPSAETIAFYCNRGFYQYVRFAALGGPISRRKADRATMENVVAMLAGEKRMDSAMRFAIQDSMLLLRKS